MAIFGFLFRAQFGEGLFNGRKIEQRIVSEAVGTARTIENQAFGLALEDGERLAVARGGNPADKACRALLGWNRLYVADEL